MDAMEIKLILSLLLLCTAALNAVTQGQMRWVTVAYWTMVSLYWTVIVFGQ